MPIDHFGNTTGTFKNRYWINTTYYEPGGPVFSETSRSLHVFYTSLNICHTVFDSGEQNAEPLLPYYLQVPQQPLRVKILIIVEL